MSAKKKTIAAEPAKVGRPKANVDPDLVEKLASIGCSIKEIAAACNCHPDTIRDNFSTEITKGQENGKTRLRKKQIEVALAGNVSMLIFLGKNMLGQSDKVETITENTHTVKKADITPELIDEIQRIAERVDAIKPPAKLS
jgi:IS30 family transposase